ncbi:DNA-binding transcriptional activator CadC [Cedecea davisae]|uniref:Transcriptional regulatory protein n=1 Tax=Cedecea davisae DSM 4568 TaxID=566551 RepID=S3IYF6_9ENTR|nr:helix-turn-helix domain-containing protein [Cedecea davisae]EPF18000.1 transcriptional regulatory protein [Cedecea davisae DSM 4568]SUX28321.1 DNA-binding transcriptional activator CadC [Cedecea davisae]
MRYRINHSIIYTPDDGTVKLTADGENEISSGEISLAPTANRLLAMLISHHGSILQRDELLNNVWDAHGLRASNNSLNQYISVLRRNFADLGLEETVIVTIPTVGFMFSKDIQVIVEDAPAAGARVQASSSPRPAASPPGEGAEGAIPRAAKFKKWAIVAALALLTAANGWFFLRPNSAAPVFEQRFLLGTLESCPVYTFYKTDSSSQSKYMDLVRKSMERASFHCKPDREIFFKIEDRALYHQKATMFIAICSRLKENEFSGCRSYYTN